MGHYVHPNYRLEHGPFAGRALRSLSTREIRYAWRLCELGTGDQRTPSEQNCERAG